MSLSPYQIELFTSLFKGRQDVFAKRWQSKDKNGYTPAFDYDRNQYALHMAAGGTLKDFPHKTYSKLTDETIKAHLEGREVVGIYPLLENNTSWFVAVDFDEANWKKEILQLHTQCSNNQLPAYIERSRSGNGGHLWIFVTQPYPAYKSRAIIRYLLKNAGINSKHADSSSFDRIFPNQDSHSGKGLGNLIALPFQKKSLENGNSCFINPATFEPFPDQWEYLTTIERVEITFFEKLWSEISQSNIGEHKILPLLKTLGEGIQIFLDKKITISRNNLPTAVIKFLKESLKVTNPEFFMRRATGQNIYNVSSSATTLEEHPDRLIVPRGFIGTLLRYCKANKLKYQLSDQREKVPDVEFECKGQLYEYQQPALAITDKKEMGVIVAPPGTGKTIIGLSIIAQKKQPTLIIVHRRQLLDQWVQQIQAFLGIPKYKIGKITKGQVDVGKEITVAMIQSLSSPEIIGKIEKSFGTILVDECHHTASDSYQSVLNQLHTYFMYGLTATPFRRKNDEQLIFAQIGEIIHTVTLPEKLKIKQSIFINIIDTDLDIPFNAPTDNAETLYDILLHDTARNNMIASDVRYEVSNGRNIIVLTERIAHIEILNQFIKQTCETITLSGDDTDNSKKSKFKQIEDGRFQVLITTGQFLGEGIDIGILDCLFIVFPCSFEGKLIQYIGRVQRSENTPTIYDYRDLNIPYLEKMFQKRNKYYNKLAHSGMIKTYEEYLLKFEEDRFYIGNQSNAYSISILNLGMNVERFQSGIVWKIKVLKYDEEQSSIFAEILNYNVIVEERIEQLSFSLLPVEQIRFRTIDTGGLLKSVVLKKMLPISSKGIPIPYFKPMAIQDEETNEEIENEDEIINTPIPTPVIAQWWIIEKSIKVPFKKVQFGNGCVTIPFYFAEIRQDILMDIANADIRPEFEVIKNYFSKILKTKSITVNIKVKHDKRKVLSYEATSEEVNAINGEIIETVRFEFVRRDFVKFKNQEDNKSLQTFEDLKQSNSGLTAIIENESSLISELLKMETAKHYHQLKYLAEKHEATVLKLRFILQPFSFIFLIAGATKYHLVWETLDSEEATYLWHIDKTKDALRIAIKEIELSLTEMKQTGRQSYIKKAPEYFSRIIHDYTDTKKGFVEWKGLLEERIV